MALQQIEMINLPVASLWVGERHIYSIVGRDPLRLPRMTPVAQSRHQLCDGHWVQRPAAGSRHSCLLSRFIQQVWDMLSAIYSTQNLWKTKELFGWIPFSIIMLIPWALIDLTSMNLLIVKLIIFKGSGLREDIMILPNPDQESI